MKNIKRIILVVAVLVLSITVNAQEKITEGVVSSKMTMSSTNPDVQSQFDMIGDILSTTYFKGDKTRTEVKNMMTGESTNIIDNSEKKMIVIMNNPMAGGKVYAESSIEASEEDLKNVTVTKTTETKTVLGYECTKYDVVANKDGADAKMEIFATDKISAVNHETTFLGDKFNGYPLFMVVHLNQMGMDMRMTYEATKITAEKVADAKFDMTIPEEYKKMDKLSGM